MNKVHPRHVWIGCALSAALFSAPAAVAATASYLGPFGPGAPIVGEPIIFALQGAQLTQPTGGDPNFLLTIETNYGAVIPGSTQVIPSYLVGGVPYEIGDFLFTWSGNSYGLVLSAHDGYTAGDLYEAAGFQTSAQVLAPDLSPRPSLPVWLDAGGTLIGTGALSGAQTGDGTTNALYTITDSFSAPSGFLETGLFTIDMSSAICANGFMTGDANFALFSDVPEPGTLFLLMPALVLLPFLRLRLL